MASYGRKYSREDTARMIQAEGDGLADQLRDRIAALEAQIAALKTELTDTKRKTANLRETNRALMERANRRKAQVNKMQRERDALRGDVRNSDHVVALDFRIAALTAERDGLQQNIATLQSQLQSVTADRDSETRWAHHYFTAWQSARQSRARLVAHVRRLRAKFSETMPDSAFVKRITDERDAARAWAAAWKAAALYERRITLWPPTFARTAQAYRASGSIVRRVDRAVAAEAEAAQERR